MGWEHLQDMGEQLATSVGSSLYQLMLTYCKENLKGKSCCVGCTTTMTQCMSLHPSEQGFLNRGGGVGDPHCAGGWKILLEGFNLYDGGNLSSEFEPSNLFQGQKQHSVNIEH